MLYEVITCRTYPAEQALFSAAHPENIQATEADESLPCRDQEINGIFRR